MLSDIVMPGLSGPQVYARISAFAPGVPVLYISGYSGDPVSGRGVNEERAGFLQKPFTAAEQARKVRDVLDEAARERRTG